MQKQLSHAPLRLDHHLTVAIAKMKGSFMIKNIRLTV